MRAGFLGSGQTESEAGKAVNWLEKVGDEQYRLRKDAAFIIMSHAN